MVQVKEGVGEGHRKGTIFLGPGPGFGSGRHATTRCCLCMMETFLEGYHPVRVLDAGCGSGILSIAAALLGARKVLGVDLQEDAVDTARGNVGWSNVQDVVSILRGDVREIRGNYDLILANLDPDGAVKLGETLAKRLVPGGYFMLSGLAGFETDRALKHLVGDHGLNLLEHAIKQAWSTLLLGKPRVQGDARSSDL